jgi:hypothetical protein
MKSNDKELDLGSNDDSYYIDQAFDELEDVSLEDILCNEDLQNIQNHVFIILD